MDAKTRQQIEQSLGEGAIPFFEEHGIAHLEKREPHHSVYSIGFSEREQKWYGWSHRAIYGFGIGSEVKKGNCAYTPDNVDELADEHVAFMADVENEEQQAKRRARVTKDYANGCIHIGVERIAAPVVNSIAGLQAEIAVPGSMGTDFIEFGGHTVKVGRGAWTAKTLEDAKQMALDFSDGVS